MASSAVWKDKLEFIDNSKRMLYSLERPGDIHVPHVNGPAQKKVNDFFEKYCKGNHYYVKLAPKQSQLLAVPYPTFISIQFFKDVSRGDGSYAWHENRHAPYNEYCLKDGRLIAALQWDDFVKVFTSEIRDKGPNKWALKGGYLMPARTADGSYELFELPTNFTTFHIDKTWVDIWDASTKISDGDNDITKMRAFNPDPGQMTLIIRPYGAGPEVEGDVSSWTRNGVPFDRVRTAFQQIQSESAVQYVFDFSGQDSRYFHLADNPFYHYSTWISHQHLNSYLSNHPDWPYPIESERTRKLVRKLNERLQPSDDDELYMDDLVYKEHRGSTLRASSKRDMIQDPKLTYDNHCCFIPLQAEKIIAAAGKRKGTKSQKAVMNNVSAPQLAKDLFNWDAYKKMGTPHIAEWLHLSAFAYGGLTKGDEAEAWNSSQIQLNLVFGSSETNSVMLRVEKAWQEFFKLEHELRALYRNAMVSNPNTMTGPVTGELLVLINRDLEVMNFEQDGNGDWFYNKKPFNGNEWWEWCFEQCPCICFTMGYVIGFYSKSELLDWENPTFDTDFYPFTRLFFTKGESQVDIKLLKDLFEDKKAELAQELLRNQQEPVVSNADPLGMHNNDMQQINVEQMHNYSEIQEEEQAVSHAYDESFAGAAEEQEPSYRVVLEPESSDSLKTEYMEAAPSIWRASLDGLEPEVTPTTVIEANESITEVRKQSSAPENAIPEEMAPLKTTDRNGPPSDSIANVSIGDLEAKLIGSSIFDPVKSLGDVFDPKVYGLRTTLMELPEAGETNTPASGTDHLSISATAPESALEEKQDKSRNEGVVTDTEIEPGASALQQGLPVDISSLTSATVNSERGVQSPQGADISAPCLIIGGAPVENPKLVMATEDNLFADVAVSIQPVAIPATSEALLLAPFTGSSDSSSLPEPPTLLLSAAERSDVQIVGQSLIGVGEIEKMKAQSSAKIGVAALSTFEMSAKIKRLFGINGLSAQLYTLQSSDPNVPVLERVKLLTTQASSNPIGILFPYIQEKVMETIPIQNLELVYSEDRKDFLNSPGLRVEADIAFEGSLQPVADSLQYLFGDKDVAPKSLHVTAHLSSDRDWSRMPVVTTLCLQGSFQKMSFRIGEILDFTSIGVEVSATKVSTAGTENRWRFGYGFFGSLQIRGLLGGDLPTQVDYRLRKTGDLYRMAMRLSSDEWKGMFGIEALTIRQVQFETSFSSKSFQESLTIRISAFMTLRKAQVFLSGQYSKAETFLEAEIGNLSWDEVRELYAELTGQSVMASTEGNDLRFESLYLRLSNKGVVLGGSVSFNEHTSAHALISFNSDGLQISGGIKDFSVPDTDIEIKDAGLDVFIGSRSKATPDAKAARVCKFALHGTVEFGENKVSAGLHLSSGAPGQGRQWMLYASFEGDLKLSRIAKALEGSDMDIALKRAAIVASNIDQTKGGAAGMNAQVNPLNFPTGKGLSFCALIEPLSAINQLNKGKTVDGLMLVASFDPSGKIGIAIRLPSAMKIDFGDTASLGNFGVAVEVSKQSKLILDGDLSLTMENQDPLVLQIAVYAGLVSAGGFVKTKTTWKNPFGLSERVEIKYLALDLEIIYATVFVSGPSKLGLAGTVKVGDIDGSAAISVSQMPDQQLLSVDISKINVAEMIKFAGKLADCQQLQDMQGGDFLVFLNASMYFSTGATVAGVDYPAGINASGTMILFGKTASFSASLGKSGVRFAGSVNAFKIGPLEVKSASGAPDASMEIVMTPEEQKFFLDGMIKILAFEAKLYIDISLQPTVAFDVDVDIRFADVFKFVLKAKAKNVSNLKDLSKADLDFQAEVSGDIFGLICDSVIGILSKIEELGDEGFQAVDKQLHSEINQINQQLEGMAKEVEEAKSKTKAERTRRSEIFDLEEAKRQKAQKELQDLEEKVRQARNSQTADIEAARTKLREAETHRETVVQNKRLEYEEKIKNAKAEQSKVQREQGLLEQQMQDKYGPIRVMKINSAGQLQKLTVQQAIVDQLKRELSDLEQRYRNSDFLDKPGLLIMIGLKEAQIKAANFVLEPLGDAWNYTNSKLNDAGFKSLDETLVRGTDTLMKVNNGLQALQTQGVSGFIRAIEQDEDQKVADRRKELQVQERGIQRHIDAIREAQSLLDSRRPDLESIIAKADEKILQTKEDKELATLEVQYDIKAENEARTKQQVEQLRANLELLHKDFKSAVKDLKTTVEKIKNATFRITRIAIQVNARDLVNGKPMKFEIEGKVGNDNVGPFTIEWAPFETPADLYGRIAKKAISL